MDLKFWLQMAAVVTGLIATAIWWWAASVKTPASFAITTLAVHQTDPQAPTGAQVLSAGSAESPDLQELAKALARQAWLNRWAAGFTGAAVALQAGATLAGA